MNGWRTIEKQLENWQGPSNVKEKALELARELMKHSSYTSWLLTEFTTDTLSTAIIALAGDLTCTCVPEKRVAPVRATWALTRALTSLGIDVSFRREVEACINKLVAMGVGREAASERLVEAIKRVEAGRGRCILPRAALEVALEAGVDREVAKEAFFYGVEPEQNNGQTPGAVPSG